MFNRFKSEFERELVAGLRPTQAPASLWSRVESGLHPRPARSLAPIGMGLALAFSLTAGFLSGLPEPAADMHRAVVQNSCQPIQRRGFATQPASSAHIRTVRFTGRQECVGCHMGV